MAEPIRVLITDDQQLVRTGFRMILSVADDIAVVGEAANGAEAIEQVAALAPDVVLMDVQMPVLDGIEATRQIADRARVVILTTFDRDDYLFEALKAGAAGFLLKNCEPERLLEAIRTVAEGGALLAPEVTRRVIAEAVNGHKKTPDHPALAYLTAREAEVLSAIARGLSNQEIAETLVVSEATVKTHVSSCLAKLGVRDRVQAVIFAYENGLVCPER